MRTKDWIQEQVRTLGEQWAQDERWEGIERAYGADEVVRLRGSVVRSARSRGSAPSGSGAC